MTSDESSAIEYVRQLMVGHIPFNTVLGIQLGALRPGFARLEIPWRDELIGDPERPAIHGGVISALIDTAAGAAAFTLVDVATDRV